MSSSRALALGLLAAIAAPPALAAERTPFETVKGWEIERTVGDTSANPCIMSHSYKDKDDDNAENAVVFALDGSKAVLVLGYENWEWDKDEKVKVPFVLGKKVINAKSNWVGDGTLLKGVFADSLVPDLLAAKTIVLRFDDGDADFEIAGFPQAYESLRRCDIAKPSVAAAPVPAPAPAAVPAPAPAPAQPSEARLQTYIVGVMAQQVIKECDVSTTAKQRTALDAKMNALKPEMTAVETQVREQVDKRPAPHCPPAEKEASFQTTLRELIDKTPEEFVVAMDKREAEEKAAPAGAKPARP